MRPGCVKMCCPSEYDPDMFTMSTMTTGTCLHAQICNALPPLPVSFAPSCPPSPPPHHHHSHPHGVHEISAKHDKLLVCISIHTLAQH
jgi:hypothetical protein